MDVVVSDDDTYLIREAKKNRVPCVSGIFMTFVQAAEQYKIYTNTKAPLKQMLNAYNLEFNRSIEL